MDPPLGYEMVRNRPDELMYSKFSYCFLKMSKALFTFEESIIMETGEAIDKAINLISKERKSTELFSISGLFKRFSYFSYSMEQLHAEILYALLILMKMMTNVLVSNGVGVLIKSGVQLTTSYRIIRAYTANFHDEGGVMKKTLGETSGFVESVLLFCVGLFNMAIPTLPAKALSLLSILGMKGDTKFGTKCLMKVHRTNYFVSPAAGLTLGLFYVTMRQLIDVTHELRGNQNLEEIRSFFKQKYPNNLVSNVIEVKFLHCVGKQEEAIALCEEVVKRDLAWPQLKHVFLMEKLWCEITLGRWKDVQKSSLELYEESKWSKTMFSYIHGCSFLMDSKPLLTYLSNDKTTKHLDKLSLCENSVKYLEKVPTHLQRFMGKSLPDEKYLWRRSVDILNSKICTYPLYELLYQFIFFTGVANNPAARSRFLDDFQQVHQILPQSAEFNRERMVCQLMMGTLHLHANDSNTDQYIGTLESILEIMPKFGNFDLFVYASAACELALHYCKTGNAILCEKYIKIAKGVGARYTMEYKVQVRLLAIEHRLQMDREKKEYS